MSFASKYLRVGGRKFTTSGQSGTMVNLSQSLGDLVPETIYNTGIPIPKGTATIITLYTTAIT